MESLHRASRMEDGIRDKIDLSIRGQVVDNAGQRSPGPFQLVLMMTAWVRVRLLITLVNDLPGPS